MHTLDLIYRDVFDFNTLISYDLETASRLRFPNYIAEGVSNLLLGPHLLDYDLYHLNQYIDASKDRDIPEHILSFLYDNVLLRVGERVIETPQYFFMRISMNHMDMDRTISDYKFYAQTLDFSDCRPDFIFNNLSREVKELNTHVVFDYRTPLSL